jgi:hypothetical protein
MKRLASLICRKHVLRNEPKMNIKNIHVYNFFINKKYLHFNELYAFF